MSISRTCSATWLLAVAAVGCRPAEEIRSYGVPKETAAAAASNTAIPSEPADRMITAILPDGDRAWFLKVAGPIDEMQRQLESITKFLESVRVAPAKPHPDWQLPEGWEAQAGTGMRAATIWIPNGDQRLEMSVTALPWAGGEDELLSNVNRWRGQMQLTPIGASELADCTREIAVGDAELTLVDLEGSMQSGGMMPPFAQRAQRAGSSPSPNSSGEFALEADNAALPAGHPPIAPGATSAAAELTYDAPKSWETLPASGMRKAAFRIVSNAGQALVTVMDFPVAAGPMIADPLANANRWRGEVSLPPIEQAQLGEIAVSVEVDGRVGTRIDAIPDPSQPDQSRAERGTIAAMVADGPKIWFFKLNGDRDLVAAERDNFQSFLESVRFAPAGGAGDGDE
jgi:hypothetical protein